MPIDGELMRAEKIEILLAEYTVLHTKIVQMNGAMFQTYGIGAVAVTAIVALTYQASAVVGLILLVLLPICLVIAFRFTHVETVMTGARVREIEATLNALAGERLLVWHSDFGIVSTGYGSRLRRVFGLQSN